MSPSRLLPRLPSKPFLLFPTKKLLRLPANGDSANELDKFKDFRFVKVDIDDLKAVAEEVGVSKPATFHMYKNGQKTNDLQSNQQDDLIKFLETGL